MVHLVHDTHPSTDTIFNQKNLKENSNKQVNHWWYDMFLNYQWYDNVASFGIDVLFCLSQLKYLMSHFLLDPSKHK